MDQPPSALRRARRVRDRRRSRRGRHKRKTPLGRRGRLMREAHQDLLPPTFWEDVERGRVLILFPGSGASSLEDLEPRGSATTASGAHLSGDVKEIDDRHGALASTSGQLTLLVIDGTWQQAKEMFREVRQNPHLGSKLHQVSFPPPPPPEDEWRSGRQQSPGVLRKQPAKGCVTTLEAVAFALYYLERALSGGSEAHAEAVRSALLRPLEAMVEIQVQHGACSVPRTYGEESKLARTLLPSGRPPPPPQS
jgi:hypothetical protein